MSTFYFMLKRTLKGIELMSSSKFWNAWEESSPLGASSRHSGVANLVRKRLWAIIKRKFVSPLEFLRCLPQQREEEGLVWSPCRQLWGNAHLRWRRRWWGWAAPQGSRWSWGWAAAPGSSWSRSGTPRRSSRGPQGPCRFQHTSSRPAKVKENPRLVNICTSGE